jgi:hypothetical protein
MEKIFNKKNFNYFIWSPLGSRGNIYINFCIQVHFQVSAAWYCSNYLPPVSMTPLANLPPVSLIPVAICDRLLVIYGVQLVGDILLYQCCGFMKFWYGSGSADPYFWLMILLFSSATFQTSAKNNFFSVFFFFLFEGTFTSFFKD